MEMVHFYVLVLFSKFLKLAVHLYQLTFPIDSDNQAPTTQDFSFFKTKFN